MPNQIKKILLLLVFISILTIRRDGYFPFSANLPTQTWLLISTIHAIGIFILYIIFHTPKLSHTLITKIATKYKNHTNLVNLILALSLTFTTLFLLWNELHKFDEQYQISLRYFLFLGLICGGILIFGFYSKKKNTKLLSIFLIAMLLMLLTMRTFPITAKVSDLLPIIIKQNQAFLKGENIYQYYLLDNGISTQAVRQPGTTLSYLPAVLLNIDVRIMSIIFMLLTAWIFIKFFEKEYTHSQKHLLVIILILFLLNPYRIIRHDLYEPVYWFLFTLSMYLLYSKKLIKFAFIWGISIFVQVWSWLFSPFVSLYIWKKYGFKKAITITTIYISVGLLLLLPFILKDPNAYYTHVFGYYRNLATSEEFHINTMFLIPILYSLKIHNWITLIQITSVGIIGTFSIKYLTNFNRLLYFLGLTMLIFLNFNLLSWNYMYLNVVLIMIISVIVELKDASIISQSK